MYLHLAHNGDPYGKGFYATETKGRHDTVGVYRGDLGNRTRAFWRTYARRNGYKLVEC